MARMNNAWMARAGAALMIVAAASCARREAGAPAANGEEPSKPKGTVSYIKDVHPILAQSCAQCHMGGRDKGDFKMDDREAVLKGGASGPAVVVGKSAESYLIKLVEATEAPFMPMKGARLTVEEVEILKKWIDEGLQWETGKALKKVDHPVASLAPRKVDPPPAAKRWFFQEKASENPIDRILAPYFKQKRVKASARVDDAAYARRAYLDVVGLPPTAKELEAFVGDRDEAKREKLAEKLLGDTRGYAEHWMTFWNDMLRNDFQGTGYIDGGREQITEWLYRSLAEGKPYDQFVRELVSPNEKSRGFIKGIVWRGVTNASQTPAMQASQNIGQVIMGTNLKCASCHDSFVNHWKLSDSYGLAAIFADEPLELVRCDAPQGEMAKMKFLYPELGEIDPAKPKAERMAQLAACIVKKENGRLTRTIVNRIWAKMMGRGLVEPLDDMDMPAWNADLLDFLAWDLAENGYDLKRTIRLIATSRAYQMPVVASKENQTGEFVFRGPEVRRLSVEQFLDSISALTGVWQANPASSFDLPVRLDSKVDQEGAEKRAAGIREGLGKAQWIWADADAAGNRPQETIYVRKIVTLPEMKTRKPERADLLITADNKFTLFVNGEKLATGADWNKPVAVDLRGKLLDGENLIAIQAENTAPSPAGLLVCARIVRGGETFDIASDATWLASKKRQLNWMKPDFKPAEGWSEAKTLGGVELAVWNIRGAAEEAAASAMAQQNATLRAWLAKPDALMIALGRPNREQVVTRRPSVATTLEALEMTNGAGLAQFLKRGAERLAEEDSAPPKELAERLYVQALGRKPTGKELALAEEMLEGEKAAEGLEDLLWTLAMSPEFQLIY